MYDSIDHLVACSFMACVYHIQNFNNTSSYKNFKSNSQHITFYLHPSIVVFKPYPLTVIMVTKCTYYY